MAQEEIIKQFEAARIRVLWDEEQEKYFFSVVDVIRVLTESVDATAYWRKLKQRLKDEGNQTVTNCHALKMTAPDGKKRLTDVADKEQLFRIIQSVPSRKAEPIKLWLAHVASERVEHAIDPEKSIDQAVADPSPTDVKEGNITESTQGEWEGNGFAGCALQGREVSRS